ncbi:MAG: hypothetical protein JOY95_05880, partial [Silvibacterium sp.]|nr:hypothetical protein [Silvibacterium sp.]
MRNRLENTFPKAPFPDIPGATEGPTHLRHPSPEEQRWEKETLGPAMEKAPERPIGKASGINLDEDGKARFTTVSGTAVERVYTPA